MRVAIVQSNYIPWRGYFDLISSVDRFVLFDDVQFTRRDWRNRNRIQDDRGPRWLSIPVQNKGKYTQLICETKVSDPGWATKHWQIVRDTYRKAPRFCENRDFVADLYGTAPGPFLSEINRHFLNGICGHLGIDTPLCMSTDYEASGVKTDRLLNLCLQLGATEYVSGPTAKSYLDEDRFNEAGIEVSWFKYGPYAEYRQPYQPFDPNLTILDLLLCTGEDAEQLIVPKHEQHITYD